MKKNIIMACVWAFGLIACTGDYTDWADPQTTSQDDVADISMTVKVEAPANIIEMEEQDSLVQVFIPIEISGTVTPEYIVELTTDEGNQLRLPVTADGYVTKDELSAAIVELYGKKQAERKMTAQVIAQVVVDGVTLKATSESYTLYVLPAVPDLNYWIYGKQNSRDTKVKTLPLMPVTKETQTVTAYFSGKLDSKMWSDDTFGDGTQAYGAQGGNKSTSTGEFAVGGGYICSPTVGWYTLTFNFATYQYSFEKLTNQDPTAYTTIGLIGDFNSWGGDVSLTQVTNTAITPSHCWYALDVELTAGGVKFRADGGWDINWGTDVNVKDNNYGVGTQNGANITVPAGIYNVYFNDITGEFLFLQQ